MPTANQLPQLSSRHNSATAPPRRKRPLNSLHFEPLTSSFHSTSPFLFSRKSTLRAGAVAPSQLPRDHRPKTDKIHCTLSTQPHQSNGHPRFIFRAFQAQRLSFLSPVSCCLFPVACCLLFHFSSPLHLCHT